MPGGPGRFARSSTSSALLWRAHVNGALRLSPTGLSPSVVRLSRPLPLGYQLPKCRPYNPQRRTPGFGLFRFRSPLLTESLLLSFPKGTEMFQFPGLAAAHLWIQCAPFGHPGLNARLTAPPGFSQSSTPFFAFWRQDIPHTPLVAWPHCSCPLRPRRDFPTRSPKARDSLFQLHGPMIDSWVCNDPFLFLKARAQITQKLLCLTIAR